MTLDQLCCSIESAKKLRELGFNKNSIFYRNEHTGIITTLDIPPINNKRTYYPAYTAAELIEVIERSSNEWSCGYNDSGCFYRFVRGERGCGSMLEGFGGKSNYISDLENINFTESLAQWVIYLLENKLINMDEVNK